MVSLKRCVSSVRNICLDSAASTFLVYVGISDYPDRKQVPTL